MMSLPEFILVTVTIVLVAAWCISRWLLASHVTRDLIWRTALVLVALIPLLALIRGAIVPWQFPLRILPPAPSEIAVANRHVPVSRPVLHVADLEEPFLITSDQSSQKGPAAIAVPELDEIPVAPTAGYPSAESPVTAIPATARTIPWRTILASLWLAGALIQVVRMGRACWQARRLIASAESVTDAAAMALSDGAAERVGLLQPARLLASPKLDVPVVTGLWRPTIILPTQLLAETARPQLRAALLHECGHIRRRDLAYDVLLQFVLAGFWLHPLVHLLARELRRLREEICDNFVLAEISAVAYSDLLLQLALGKTLRPAVAGGLGIFDGPGRLELRIKSLLAPGRLVDTRAGTQTRRFVLGFAAAALAAMIAVRVERAIADRPELSASGKTAEKNGAAAGQNSGNEKDKQQRPPRSYSFKFVTARGEPVVGASVTLWGLMGEEGSIGFDKDNVVIAKTDSNGAAAITFTEKIEDVAQALYGSGRRSGVEGVALRVDHPDHPIWSDYIRFPNAQPIVLADATTIEVRARRQNETALATRLYPEISSHHAGDWSESDGVLTIRRVDVSGQRASRWLRIVQVPETGPAWFSETVDLKHLGGNPISLEVTLQPSVRVEGRLSEDVPRPVVKGRVIGHVTNDSPANGNVTWVAVAEVAADGSFVLESLPANGNLQVIALCDGWVSRSPSSAEVTDYFAKHSPTGGRRPNGNFGPAVPADGDLSDFDLEPGEASFTPSAGMAGPQLFRLGSPVVQVGIDMQPTAACEVTVVDESGAPLPGASVQFFPNQVVLQSGSSILGSGRDEATLIRERLAAGKSTDDTRPGPGFEAFTADTDDQGVARISGLPATDAPGAFRQAQFHVAREGYVAISNFQASLVRSAMMPVLVVELAPGKTERITVRMRPPRATEPGAIDKGVVSDEAPVKGRVVLAGRVRDEAGRPLPDVEVLVGGDDSCHIRTDQEGRFHLDVGALGDGEAVAAPGAAVPADADDLAAALEMEFPVGFVRFVKPGYALHACEVKLNQPDQIVTLQNNTCFEGVVRFPDGTPAANTKVRANIEFSSTGPGPMTEDFWTETTSDAQGRYKLLVQPGMHAIHADAGALSAWLPKRSGRQRDPNEPTRLPIVAGETKALDIKLEPAAEVLFKFLDGETKKPIAEAQIQESHGAYPGVHAISDALGRATIQSLPAGETLFSIYAPGYLRSWSDEATPSWIKNALAKQPPPAANAQVYGFNVITFRLKPGLQQITILMEPVATIAGRVLDPEGNPVANATVSMIYGDSDQRPLAHENSTGYTDKNGGFKLQARPSLDRQFRLVASPGRRHRDFEAIASDATQDERHDWASGVTAPLQTIAGQKIENIELRLAQPGTIRGRVVDKSGRPVARAVVQSFAADYIAGPLHTPVARTDQNGRFELRTVRPGPHRLRAGKSPSHDSAPSADVPTFDVKAGEATDAGEIVMSPE